LLRASETPTVKPPAAPALAGELGSAFGKAKNVIVLWLQGGPPQHETFDPKPDAPAEIRGEFKPIATNVPASASANCSREPRATPTRWPWSGRCPPTATTTTSAVTGCSPGTRT